MAVNTPFGTIAAAVATIGAFCGYDTSHAYRHANGTQSPESCAQRDQQVKEKSRESHGRGNRNPVLAPQFDGLYCYETLVNR